MTAGHLLLAAGLSVYILIALRYEERDLVGSVMDWREDDFAAGFVFDNPNAKGACGCGESFTV
jgi:Fe-S cluster assembly iron-binding protein IscA